jgi:hypothetical protein
VDVWAGWELCAASGRADGAVSMAIGTRITFVDDTRAGAVFAVGGEGGEEVQGGRLCGGRAIGAWTEGAAGASAGNGARDCGSRERGGSRMDWRGVGVSWGREINAPGCGDADIIEDRVEQLDPVNSPHIKYRPN